MDAVALATEALQIADDSELRHEVSAWLESLGDTTGAARVLRAVVSSPVAEPVEVAGALLRMGVLKSRAGDATGAAVAFEAAIALDVLDSAVVESVTSLGSEPDPDQVFRDALGTGAADALADLLTSWISRPRPLADVRALFIRGLSELERLDVDRALVLARRSLDVFGPRDSELRDAMMQAATMAHDESFAAAIAERSLDACSPGMDRAAQWIRLASACEIVGDFEGEARAIARVVGEGSRVPEVGAHLDRLSQRELSPDGRIEWLRARTGALVGDASKDAVVQSGRELAAALWDMADDRSGALEAWRHVGRVSAEGAAALTFDMVEFCGQDFAFEQIGRWLDDKSGDVDLGDLATGAATAAFSLGALDRAFDLARRALESSPRSSRALEIAEAAEERLGRRRELSALYDCVASHALGRFGRRAAHHRGARRFERVNDYALALRHAVRAFNSVPTPGHAIDLLARMAERAGDPLQAVRAVELQADGEQSAPERARWLVSAAGITGRDADGLRTRTDLLLRAVATSPTVTTVALLRHAASELIHVAPAEREGLGIRVGHAARAVEVGSRGPSGARTALAFAYAELELFENPDAALASIEVAMSMDAAVGEYATFVSEVARLSKAEQARERVRAMVTSAEAIPGAGAPLMSLLEALAKELGDEDAAARALAARARRDPNAGLLVIEVDEALPPTPTIFPPSSAPAPDRAARWADIAARRRKRGDYGAALQAQREACTIGPSVAERWNELEWLAEHVGDDAVRMEALEGIALSSAGEERLAALKRLARLHERRDEVDAASRTWQRIVDLDPSDEDAECAHEAALAAAGRYEELVAHLALRASRMKEKPGADECLPAVRLRRVAILEQRLGDVAQACAELELLLGECPDHLGAIRYMADLLDRSEQPDRSAPLWHRAASLEANAQERFELELRAGRASLAAGDAVVAFEAAQRLIQLEPARVDALALRVDALRILHRDAELGDALDALARAGIDARARVDSLLEAAVAASRARDPVRAIERARRAALLAGDRATPPLLAQALEYRLRGPGDAEQARRTVAELSRMGEPLGRDDEALRSFLVAEALDVVHDDGAGMRELEATRAVIGDHPLLAVGVAERLATKGDHAEALREYRVALSGSLLDLRRPGAVAMAAAEVATRSGREADKARFLEMAETYAELRGTTEPPPRALGSTVDLVAAAEASRVLGSAGAMETLAQQSSVPQWTEVDPRRTPMVSSQFGGGQVSAEALRFASSMTTMPSPAKGFGPSTVPAPTPEIAALEVALRNAKTPSDQASARLELGQARLARGDSVGAEPLFWAALSGGCARAGDELESILGSARDRARDRVRLRWQQADLEPYDVDRLWALRTAALEDGDSVYAKAVEHVLRSLDPAAPPIAPPSLTLQPEQPGLFALLARPSMDSLGEAFALLWEGAMQLFLREAASYSITGIERVVPGPASLLARLLEVALRVLDSPRIPVFATRTDPGKPVVQAALLSPASVILSGSVLDDTPSLRYALGTGLSAALPQNILRLGLPPSEGRTVLDALMAAFGPAQLGRAVEGRAARLAESFWQIVPARVQRRLQELLAGAKGPDFDDVVERAAHAGRRVGMFVAGDFSFAAGTVLSLSPAHETQRLTRDTVQGLCADLPAVLDLLRLAVSPEYAHARWHSEGSAARPSLRPSTRFSLV
jgi:tetratricopeptide (TPR) repeat protein